jgi:hypothetical protein
LRQSASVCELDQVQTTPAGVIAIVLSDVSRRKA